MLSGGAENRDDRSNIATFMISSAGPTPGLLAGGDPFVPRPADGAWLRSPLVRQPPFRAEAGLTHPIA